MTDDSYGWLLGEKDGPAGLSLCPGGFSPSEVTGMLRNISRELSIKADHPVAWLVLRDKEAIGMVSFTRRNDDDSYELGYGLAAAHRGGGITTRAVALLIEDCRRQGHA